MWEVKCPPNDRVKYVAAPQVEGYSSSSSDHNNRIASKAEKLCMAPRRPRMCCYVGAEPAQLRAQIPE